MLHGAHAIGKRLIQRYEKSPTAMSAAIILTRFNPTPMPVIGEKDIILQPKQTNICPTPRPGTARPAGKGAKNRHSGYNYTKT